MTKTFKNSIQLVNIKDFKNIRSSLLKKQNTWIVEIDGSKIQSWKAYIQEIESKFKFPTTCTNNVDGYLDWMRDLGWLDKEEFVLIINHFSFFMKNNPKVKNEIISDFVNVILPFWQDEVEEVVVDGKAKPFMVYLVD